MGDRFGGWLQEHGPRLLLGLADLESRVLAEAIAAKPITAPIWISGVARSGSTKLLEIFNAHPALTTHRYADFAGIFTPWWWNWLRARSRGKRVQKPLERAHGDRIQVTAESPEAFEEVLWMAHFRDLHSADRMAIFDATHHYPLFERRLRLHIAKLLDVRRASRYLAKANYHLTRFAYLLKLFPDARLIVPIRAPLTHVGSLVKQDRMLSAQGHANPSVRRHLRRAGHFEFGLDKRVPNLGDPAQYLATQTDFAQGRNAQGYARIWSAVYGHLAQQLETNAPLRAAVCVVPYERLCASPQDELRRIFDHARLTDADAARVIAVHAAELSEPTYYRSPLTAPEQIQVAEITAATASQFGY
jgi:hypothetical protein